TVRSLSDLSIGRIPPDNEICSHVFVLEQMTIPQKKTAIYLAWTIQSNGVGLLRKNMATAKDVEQ
ncbi:hypothetical protein LOS25_17365, partial [Enterococcus faecium]|nr:hypothetical protein [Enterococcus faecium]